MPYRDPSPDDPTVLVGVGLPGGRESIREMAVTFAEEFAALGWGEERLLGLFQRPHYAAAHRAYRLLGEAEIREIVGDSVRVWGRFRVVVDEPPAAATPERDALVEIGSPGGSRRPA